jgi:uncharacterized protein (DUF2147 family)
MKKSILPSAVAFIFMLTLTIKSFAQKDQLEKTWYTKENSSKVQMYLTQSGTYAGKIIWLKEPTDKDTGKPKLDKENPDANKRSTPVLGMVIMTGFKKSPDNKDEYIDGKIYDPKNGKTYCGKVTFKGNTLDMRGYLCSLTFLGRTETWTLVEGQ